MPERTDRHITQSIARRRNLLLNRREAPASSIGRWIELSSGSWFGGPCRLTLPSMCDLYFTQRVALDLLFIEIAFPYAPSLILKMKLLIILLLFLLPSILLLWYHCRRSLLMGTEPTRTSSKAQARLYLCRTAWMVLSIWHAQGSSPWATWKAISIPQHNCQIVVTLL